MKIPIISNYLKIRALRRLRSIMRGYRYLKESNQLGLIVELKEDLSNKRISRINRNATKLIFGAGINNAELLVRQYLFARIGMLNLNKAVLFTLGKGNAAVVYPLPLEWQEVIIQHNIKVDAFRCNLLWYGFVFLMILYGFAFIAISFLRSIKAILQPKPKSFGNYIYFSDLSVHNIATSGKNSDNNGIITWYLKSSTRMSELDSICHSVKDSSPILLNNVTCSYIPSAIVPINELNALLRYFGWCLYVSVLVLVDILRGQWWHGLLLSESSKAKQIRLQNCDKLAKEYLFHNSGWIYRPLWSYEAEERRSKITFYFYSTNCETFKHFKGYPIQANSWQLMSWPWYLVWDEYQADFVRRAVGEKVNITVVGPIDFISSPTEMIELPTNSIAVFDVQPVRDSYYCSLGIAFDYYLPEICNQFLIDIYNVLKNNNGILLHKRKRIIGNLAHYKYRNILRNLGSNSNYLNLDSRFSAKRVIINSLAVISMPFTSTALLGRELGKPSIYYDPLGLIQKDDRGAHGIPIIIGVNELKEWVSSLGLK